MIGVCVDFLISLLVTGLFLYNIDNMQFFRTEQDLESPSLPELVYRRLREAILNGVFQSGQALRQEELAKRFGVSRAPLREALPRLEAEGIVVQHPRRGYSVALLDVDEITEIFDIRILIEGRTAYFATSNCSQDDLERLGAILTEMEALDLSHGSMVVKWFELNSRFHDLLNLISRKHHYCRLAEQLRTSVESYIRIEVSVTGNVDQAQREHRQILSALQERDADRVSALLQDHCKHTAARLIAGLKRREALRDASNIR